MLPDHHVAVRVFSSLVLPMALTVTGRRSYRRKGTISTLWCNPCKFHTSHTRDSTYLHQSIDLPHIQRWQRLRGFSLLRLGNCQKSARKGVHSNDVHVDTHQKAFCSNSLSGGGGASLGRHRPDCSTVRGRCRREIGDRGLGRRIHWCQGMH